MARLGKAVLYGMATIFVLALIVSFVLSLILKFTNASEATFAWIAFTCSLISFFIGGFVAGGKGQEKGWLAGGFTSVLFTLLVFLFQFLGFDELFTVQQWLYHLAFLIAAMCGGIIGVNISASRNQ
ncbi:TIGR04086 family membrane protein [Bacillus alveayuensis]|uniref:TIGR04086 family membrane protein n=1 Tax=Aeribacillus alveayuensis TaxID=279215 RepID=UPI0005D127EC|nr:TIGR04086 family membrane protein [Bacillus alveayuensis]